MERRTLWMWIALGAAAVLYAFSRTSAGQGVVQTVTNAVANALTPRGIRDNNPGNVKRSEIAWRGLLTQAEVEARGWTWDPVFCQMDTPADGVRMIGHILESYQARGLNTVSGIITEWSATDQAAYVTNVADALGVDPGAPIDVHGQAPALAAAIIEQENGQQPYDPNDLAQWVYA